MQFIDRRVDISNIRLLFDNYFSTFNLFQWLRNRNIFAVGTVRVNRFNNPPLDSDKLLKKQSRGCSDTVISEDGDVILTKWYDNRPVVFGSNFCSVGNQTFCRRWDKRSRTYINVPCPEVATLYNKGMGGVDKMDFLLSTYRSHIRSRKWTIRMISHGIDLAVANSWLEYKQDALALGVSQNKIIDLYNFRECIANSLLSIPKSRGRPSSSADPIPSTSRTPIQHSPIVSIRYDNYNHFPAVDNKPDSSRCKYEKCKSKTKYYCIKCKVNLCIFKDRNCFLDYHKKNKINFYE